MLTRMYSECANFTNVLPNTIKNISDFNAYALFTLGSNPLRRATKKPVISMVTGFRLFIAIPQKSRFGAHLAHKRAPGRDPFTECGRGLLRDRQKRRDYSQITVTPDAIHLGISSLSSSSPTCMT